MSEALTQAEVDALPDGTEVSVVWSGGNGPHRYTVGRSSHSKHPVAVLQADTAGSGRVVRDLELWFVGPGGPYTVVRLAA